MDHDTDERPTPLTYLSPTTADERPYERADHRLFLAFAFVATANVSLAVLAHSPASYLLNDLEALGAWVFGGAYVFLWGCGQFAFWTGRGESLPPFSAFALALVAALTLIGLLGNAFYLGGL